MAKRILLADDHSLMLEGLARLLAGEFEIVGTAVDGRTLVAETERLRPDIVVLDIGMPEMNGVEAARRINKSVPDCKIVFVTQQLDPAYVHAAFTAGAKAYVAKQSASEELVEAIHRALRDRYYHSPKVNARSSEMEALKPNRNPAEFF